MAHYMDGLLQKQLILCIFVILILRDSRQSFFTD